jgi:penicillin amidase
MAALQTDTLSIAAQEILPLLVPNVQPRSDQEKALLQSVAAWDGTMTRDRVEPLVFAVWMDRLKGALIADDLGDLSDTYYGERVDVLRTLLSGDADRDVSWCDDVGTPQRETCADQIQAAWNAAIDWIAAREGRPASSWRWDDFHRAAFDHQVFAAFPGLDRLASRAIPTPGGEYTVNRGSYREIDRPRPLIHVHGPGFRGVYDLSDLEHSRFALAGGESGHLTSAHYDDLLIPWRDGQGFPLIPSDASASRLTLVPAP